MRKTNALEKLIPSIINASIVLVLSLPFLIYFGHGLEWKLVTVAIFYLLQIIDTHENTSFSCFGMKLSGTVWVRKYTRLQRNIYSILYTMSFSTLLFSVYFPFDLFLFNMLILQLPSIYFSGTTLHGLLSGGMVSEKAVR